MGDFNLTRETDSRTYQQVTTEIILEAIFTDKIQSIIVAKCEDNPLTTDENLPPEHVQLDSKLVKFLLVKSIEMLKSGRIAELYSEIIIINIFMADYALSWDFRRNNIEKCDPDLEFRLIRTCSMVAPKSSELWRYYAFLKNRFGPRKFFSMHDYNKIVKLRFSNYYLHNLEANFITNCTMVEKQNLYNQHVEHIKNNVMDCSVILLFCKLWPEQLQNKIGVIEQLIRTYSQGFESLWRGRECLASQRNDNEILGDSI